jgi:DNA end-binding protein Ku
MPPRAIWSGSVSFGLVNVPVKLVTATSPKDIRFNQLHDEDGGRIQQKRVCSVDGEEVDFNHIVKGYDLGGGRYVVIDPEELRALDPEASRTIDIEEFVELADIDPIYYEHTYYLVPDARAEKAYALLVEAMDRTGKVAVGRFVLRTKQYLATLRAKEGALVLSTMLFDDEVIAVGNLEVPTADDVKPSERELAMAEQLVQSLATEFEPSKYTDEYRDQVLDLINRKAEGQEIAVQAEVPAATPVVDLMAALEASLAEARKQKKTAGDGKPAGKASGKKGREDKELTA